MFTLTKQTRSDICSNQGMRDDCIQNNCFTKCLLIRFTVFAFRYWVIRGKKVIKFCANFGENVNILEHRVEQAPFPLVPRPQARWQGQHHSNDLGITTSGGVRGQPINMTSWLKLSRPGLTTSSDIPIIVHFWEGLWSIFIIHSISIHRSERKSPQNITLYK